MNILLEHKSTSEQFEFEEVGMDAAESIKKCLTGASYASFTCKEGIVIIPRKTLKEFVIGIHNDL